MLLSRPRRAHVNETCGIVGELCCMRQALNKLYFGEWLAMRVDSQPYQPMQGWCACARTFDSHQAWH